MKKIIFLQCVLAIAACTMVQAQAHTEIEHDSELPDSPHLQLTENDSSSDEIARIWFKNATDPEDNRWAIGARTRMGSTDNDGIVVNPLVLGWNGVQKFAVSKDGEVRINKAYFLPNTDGLAGQVITTDGAGQTSWATPTLQMLQDADMDSDINFEEGILATDSDTMNINIHTGTNSNTVMELSGNQVLANEVMVVKDDGNSGAPHLRLIEEGINDLTRIYLENENSEASYRLLSKAFTDGVADNKFQINYSNSGVTTQMEFLSDMDSTISYNTFTIEQPATDAVPNLRLHQTADDYSVMSFSNGGFENNRWIVRGDPSGTAGEAPFDILWKNVVSGTTVNFMRFDAGDASNVKFSQDTEINAELTVTGSADVQTDLNVDNGVAYLDKLVVGNDVLPSGLSFVSNDDLYINNANGDVYFRDAGVNEARVGYDDDNSGGNSGELIIENNQVAGAIDFRIGGGGGTDFAMTHGLLNCSANIKPTLHKTYDLGVSGTAWDNIYCDDLIEQGAAAFTDRSVTEEILNYPPIAKKPGMFDYKNERGLEELDPLMLPAALQESNGILIDEMATYNYKANYEQQQQIKALEAQVKELQSIIKDLLDK